MSITIRDGLQFLDGLNNGTIVVESNKINEYIDYIFLHRIDSMYLSGTWYKFDNIDFLENCKTIEKINIYDTNILDFSGLAHLVSLKKLILSDHKGMVDLSLNNEIEDLTIDLSKNVRGIESLKNLKRLSLWKYKPKSKDLSELIFLSTITELEITTSQITSLNGCSNFKNLESLDVTYLSKLESIEDIVSNKKTLKNLRFSHCKKIKNHSCVSELEELEWLSFNDCLSMDNIKFIKGMKKLKNFVFMNTNIVDGDLSPCIGLEHVGFNNKKHYTHKVEDFRLNKQDLY